MSEAESTIIRIVVTILPLVIILLVMQIRKFRPDFVFQPKGRTKGRCRSYG